MSDSFDQLERELRRGVRTLARKPAVGGKQAARARWGRPALGGLLLALLASIAAVLLSGGGSSGPGLNVLAAVYAATLPRAGIVETVTLTRNYGGPGHERSERLREWSNFASQLKRGLTTITGSEIPSSDPEILDAVHTSDVYEAWSNARGAGLLSGMTNGQPNTVHRITWYGSYRPDLQKLAFVGAGLAGEAWTQTFRALYRAGQWRVVGHVRRDGRSLWMIEQDAAGAKARAREDGTRYYALVDPHTFQPVYMRLIDVDRPGDPTIYEKELLSYRTLSATASDQSLFDLAKQHPGSPVQTQAGLTPAQARKGR
ncbi:MAG TPA: hypothetical protein VFR48_01305 [Solirubrobacteraceae bacterium]|nr:hypothetical protein [Solirubrobacteraceae bacterium]